jgi:hypothetical protein
MRPTLETGLATILGIALAGCGGGSPSSPTPTLSATGRLAIARQIVNAALGGVVTGSAIGKSESVPLGNLTCEKSCAGGACAVTCPIDERFDCPAGGTATNKGLIEGTLDAELSGEAALAATQRFSACKPTASLAIDGAPSTTATGNARFVKGEVAEQQTVRVVGTVGYVSATDGSGRCAVDLQVTFDRSLKGSARGSVCAEAVDVAF